MKTPRNDQILDVAKPGGTIGVGLTGMGLSGLGLRTRFALFFALIGAGAALAVFLSGWVAFVRLGPDSLPHLVFAGLLAVFCIAGLAILIAHLFDENVAKPILVLTSELEISLSADCGRELSAETGQHLGVLAPTLARTMRAMREARAQRDEAVATATAKAERQTRRLEAVIRDLDQAVLVCALTHEILLYNRRATAAFAEVGPVGLGRCATSLIDPDALRHAASKLLAQAGIEALGGDVLDCTVCGGTKKVRGRISLVLEDGLEQPLGYVLVLDEPTPLTRIRPAERPRHFDFDVRSAALGSSLLETPLAQAAICVFDTETTGLDPHGTDRLISIGAVRFVNGRVLSSETFDALINPGRPIPAASTKIHGLTDAMVREADGAGSVIARFDTFVGNACLAAHNAAFDLAFLARARETPRLIEPPNLDTVLLGAHLFGADQRLTLDALAERFGVSIPAAARHTALGDAFATAEVLARLISLLDARGIRTIAEALAVSKKQAAILRGG